MAGTNSDLPHPQASEMKSSERAGSHLAAAQLPRVLDDPIRRFRPGKGQPRLDHRQTGKSRPERA